MKLFSSLENIHSLLAYLQWLETRSLDSLSLSLSLSIYLSICIYFLKIQITNIKLLCVSAFCKSFNQKQQFLHKMALLFGVYARQPSSRQTMPLRRRLKVGRGWGWTNTESNPDDKDEHNVKINAKRKVN